MNALALHVEKILNRLREQLALDYLSYTVEGNTQVLASSGTPPSEPRSQTVIKSEFNFEVLGNLSCADTIPGAIEPFITKCLKATAAQIATLVRNPKPQIAMAIDEKMTQLSLYSSHFNWCGVYLLEGNHLTLAAFRGAPTPHAVIDVAHGICGAAVKENQTLNIPDVNRDARYLSCDLKTRSELVVPIRNAQGIAIGEVDIDSHTEAAFSTKDVAYVEEVARELSQVVLQ